MSAVYQQNQCCIDLLILTQKINAENDFENFGQTIGLQIKAKTKSQIKFKNAFSWLRPLWLRHIGIWSSQDMNPDVFMTFALAKKYRFQFQLFIFISSKQITTQFLLSGAIVCHRSCVLHST